MDGVPLTMGPHYGWTNRAILPVGRPGVEEPARYPQVTRVIRTLTPELRGGSGQLPADSRRPAEDLGTAWPLSR